MNELAICSSSIPHASLLRGNVCDLDCSATTWTRDGCQILHDGKEWRVGKVPSCGTSTLNKSCRAAGTNPGAAATGGRVVAASVRLRSSRDVCGRSCPGVRCRALPNY